jgi:antitoxin component HigA of HigAB toxin-antitoxin module
MRIRTKIDHEKALARLSELMDHEHELGSPESDEMVKLADAIVAFEEVHLPNRD